MAISGKYFFLKFLHILFIIFLSLTSTIKVNAANNGIDFTATNYYSNAYVDDWVNSLQRKYDGITAVKSLGKSGNDHNIWAVQISDNVFTVEPGEPMVKLVANIHGNEAVGRQMMLYFTEYLLQSYSTDSRIKSLVDNTNIFIVPSANPDGFDKAVEGDCEGLVGRGNKHAIDLNEDFPPPFPNNTGLDKDEQEQIQRQPETKACRN